MEQPDESRSGGSPRPRPLTPRRSGSRDHRHDHRRIRVKRHVRQPHRRPRWLDYELVPSGDPSQSCLTSSAESTHPHRRSKGMALAELVDHVIGADPDRDRITAAVVCSRTQGEVATRSSPPPRGATARRCAGQRSTPVRAGAPGPSSPLGAPVPASPPCSLPKASSSSSSTTPALGRRRKGRSQTPSTPCTRHVKSWVARRGRLRDRVAPGKVPHDPHVALDRR